MGELGEPFSPDLAMVMEGYSFFFVSEQRRERNSEREKERSRQWRYLSALVNAGVGGGRPRRDCLLSNSSRVSTGVLSLLGDRVLGPNCGYCVSKGG